MHLPSNDVEMIEKYLVQSRLSLLYPLQWSALCQISVLVQLSEFLIHEHLKAFYEKVVRCYKDNPICQAHHQSELLTFNGQWSPMQSNALLIPLPHVVKS